MHLYQRNHITICIIRLPCNLGGDVGVLTENMINFVLLFSLLFYFRRIIILNHDNSEDEGLFVHDDSSCYTSLALN